jgi:lysophospholipase L1-like esterase
MHKFLNFISFEQMTMRLFFILLLFPVFCFAQSDSGKWVVPAAASYSFIHLTENTIFYHHKLTPVFEKLQKVKTTRRGVVRIVHIGDSHLQADMLTGILRKGFQQYFGDAGRGLVFPYQLAKSNAPSDIGSSSNVSWDYNRCAHPEICIANGCTGFGIHCADPNAYVNLVLKPVDSVPQYFNHLIFFLGKDSACYTLTAPNLVKPISKHTWQNVDTPSMVINTDSLLSEFTITRCMDPDEQARDSFSFYGVSLERRDSSGVIYHTIGCNGTQYWQYDCNPLFCHQLRAIKGDLYIISLGTNEAQNMHPNQDSLIHYCDSMVRLIHSIAPHAPIIITTPPGSYYKKRKPNAAVDIVSRALIKYCREREIPYWDLYHMSNGYTGAVQWKRNQLLSHDLVHYNKEGYELQALLFLNAFADAYNNFNKSHPYKPPIIKTKTKTVNK